LTIYISSTLEILSCKLFKSLGVESRFKKLSKSCELLSATSTKKRKGTYLDDSQVGSECLPSEERCCLSYRHCEDSSEKKEHRLDVDWIDKKVKEWKWK
jgi:hypothetical protein